MAHSPGARDPPRTAHPPSPADTPAGGSATFSRPKVTGLAANEENWQPIRADQLRIGHYIKINHSWFDHPFVRRIFMITSEEEVAIIRNARLSKLYVDHDRSTSAPPAEAPQRPPEEEQRIAERAASLKAEKIAQIDRIQEHRAALEAVALRYAETVDHTGGLLGMLNAADAASAKQLGNWVGKVVETVVQGQAPLALVATDPPQNEQQRVAMLATDAVGICGVLGRKLGLEPQHMMALTMAAAVHVCGLQRLPAPLIDEKPDGPQRDSAMFRQYPAIGAEILRQCGGFPQTVIRIVREHRERPDGSGFPLGLKGDQIHPLALVLGAVREFQVQCRGTDVEPTTALSWLFRTLRPVYGEDIIDHLISSTTVYPPGTFVQISDGSLGRVLRVNEADRMRPVIGIVDEESGGREMQIVDLMQESELSILSLVDRPKLPKKILDARRRSWSGMGLAPAGRIPVVTQPA
jgi:HD-GYP domain-containing protein (c-di-GMP phosphodiesterase class II)